MKTDIESNMMEIVEPDHPPELPMEWDRDVILDYLMFEETSTAGVDRTLQDFKIHVGQPIPMKDIPVIDIIAPSRKTPLKSSIKLNNNERKGICKKMFNFLELIKSRKVKANRLSKFHKTQLMSDHSKYISRPNNTRRFDKRR